MIVTEETQQFTLWMFLCTCQIIVNRMTIYVLLNIKNFYHCCKFHFSPKVVQTEISEVAYGLIKHIFIMITTIRNTLIK